MNHFSSVLPTKLCFCRRSAFERRALSTLGGAPWEPEPNSRSTLLSERRQPEHASQNIWSLRFSRPSSLNIWSSVAGAVPSAQAWWSWTPVWSWGLRRSRKASPCWPPPSLGWEGRGGTPLSLVLKEKVVRMIYQRVVPVLNIGVENVDFWRVVAQFYCWCAQVWDPIQNCLETQVEYFCFVAAFDRLSYRFVLKIFRQGVCVFPFQFIFLGICMLPL